MPVEKLFTPAPETPAELQARATYRNKLGNEASAEGRYHDARGHWAKAESYLRQAHEIIQAERLSRQVAA